MHTSHRLPSRLVLHRSTHPESWTTQLRWIAAAAVVGFAIPFIGSSTLGLQHDVYLGVYFVAVVALFAAYVVGTRLDLRETFRRQWKLSLILGLVFGVVLVRNVLAEDRTPHPDGAYYVFELIWRGAIYGSVDALLLTVLPCLAVYRGLGGRLRTWRRRLAYFTGSLALVLTITAVYHLGYAQYRADGIGAPETGNTLISIPMLLSTNPIGSITDHAAMHVSAVAHTYETEARLPPATNARHPSDDKGTALTATAHSTLPASPLPAGLTGAALAAFEAAQSAAATALTALVRL